MSDLTEMWTELEKYQPYADKHRFGGAWRKMCEERTKKAAYIASDSAESQAEDAAAWCACSAAYAARDAADAEEESSASWAQRAIQYVREAIELENK